jgi:glycerophosphoryl diester phosphodiesterase
MRIFLFLLVLSTSSMAQNLQITAHRCASGYAPENTIVAVRRALEIGVDRI